jgi:uncharacterized protein (TIGR02217 family)
MSNSVFPSLPGLSIVVSRFPRWKTKVQTAVSGHELRAAFMAHPKYTFRLSYEVLRAGAEAELETIVGFFNARQGAYDNFLFTDADDNAVANQGFGTGDGATRSFQLTRSFGGHTEPVMNLNGAPTIKVGGVETSAYTIDALGLVTFTVAPANGAALTWSGAYYYRCRFLDDWLDLERFLERLWQLKKVELVGSLGIKV